MSSEVVCQLGNLAVGEQKAIVFVGMVDSSVPDGTTLTNWAGAVSVSTPDPDLDGFGLPNEDTVDNVDVEDTLVVAEADVSVVKSSSPVKVYAGEQKVYEITVANAGPSDAQNVIVTDTLPAEVDYEIDTNFGVVVSEDPDVVQWNLGTMAAGESVTFQLWVLAKPEAMPGTIIVNEAVVTTATEDMVRTNNTALSANLVLGKADLKIRKFGKPDGSVEAGELLTYTVIVDNLGTGYAHNVVVSDVLRSSGEFELVSVTTDREALCSAVPGVYANDLEFNCALSGDLEVMNAGDAGRWILTIVVTADETQDIDNVATVVSSDYDPDTSNNEAYVEHDITDVADLEVVKSEMGIVEGDNFTGGGYGMNMAVAGESLEYTIVVTNYGPSTAEEVVVMDRLPGGIMVTGYTVSQGECNTGTPGDPNDMLTCGLGDLAVGESATIVVYADVAPWLRDGAILENDVLVTSDIYDPNNANDLDTNLTTVSVWSVLESNRIGIRYSVVLPKLAMTVAKVEGRRSSGKSLKSRFFRIFGKKGPLFIMNMMTWGK